MLTAVVLPATCCSGRVSTAALDQCPSWGDQYSGLQPLYRCGAPGRTAGCAAQHCCWCHCQTHGAWRSGHAPGPPQYPACSSWRWTRPPRLDPWHPPPPAGRPPVATFVPAAAHLNSPGRRHPLQTGLPEEGLSCWEPQRQCHSPSMAQASQGPGSQGCCWCPLPCTPAGSLGCPGAPPQASRETAPCSVAGAAGGARTGMTPASHPGGYLSAAAAQGKHDNVSSRACY
jgi:hypothetical protein